MRTTVRGTGQPLKPDACDKRRNRFAALALLACSVYGTASAVDSHQAKAPGSESAIPQTVLPDIVGKRHRLDDFRGKVVLLNFWTSWCPPCISEMPALKRLSRAMAEKPFQLLAINVAEGRGIAQRFASLEEAGIRLLRDADGSVAKDWGVEVYPTSVIIDGLGRRHETIVGDTDWDAPLYYDRLEELMRTTTETGD